MYKEAEAEIRGALAVMSPVARTATQRLVEFLAATPAVCDDGPAFDNAVVQASLAAMAAHGWDPNEKTRMENWIGEHGPTVADVAIAILNLAVLKNEVAPDTAWLKVGAAAVVGAIIGSLFG